MSQLPPPTPLGLDFNALRTEGIRLLQELSGVRWTDYNLHDPGVTVLEQLCFLLTDMGYRTDFEVADYLAEQSGQIDFEQRALYVPQQIFSSHALTLEDYRKMLFDAIPDITDIWIRPAVQQSAEICKGLLRVYLMLDDSAYGNGFAAAQAKVIQKVNAVYCANRCLCEDLDRVLVVKPDYFYLQGDIDIEVDSSEADVLAQILFDCANYVSSGMQVTRYQKMIDAGHQLEHIFEGPLTGSGYIDTDPNDNERVEFQITELIPLIRAIPGVKQVRSLSFRAADRDDTDRRDATASLRCDITSQRYPRLKFPDGDAQKYLKLQPEGSLRRSSDGSDLNQQDEQLWEDRNRALYREARLNYKKMMFERQTFRGKDPGLVQALHLPTGRHRDFKKYYSMQNFFPAIYGINRYGLSADANDLRRAQAKQLKGYLYPFEQIIANFLQNIEQLPVLFSTDLRLRQSYFSQQLGNQQIPDIEAVYAGPAGGDAQSLQAATARYDQYIDRRSRVLDFMLALYGEEFSQTSLTRFNQCHRDDTDAWLLDLKAQYLKQLPDLSANRATAFNYLKKNGGTESIARLQRRVGILVGMDQTGSSDPGGRTLAGDLQRFCSDQKFYDAKPFDLRSADLALVPKAAPDATDQKKYRFDQMPISTSFLRNGVFRNNYRLLRSAGKIAVLFAANGKTRLFAERFDDYLQAEHWVAQLTDYLVAQNAAAESMHIVEHILLRPSGTDKRGVLRYDDNQLPCYENRLSVVLPGQTVRFFDKNFRNFFEDTLRRLCPAHIVPTFYWLSFEALHEFETAYQVWRQRYREFRQSGKPGPDRQLDQAAQKVLHLLCTPVAQAGAKP